MRYGILGPVRLTGRGDEAIPVPLVPLQRRLLAALLLAANDVVSSERLVEAVWDDAPPADPRPALHVHITRLRQHLRDDLRTEAPGYRLVVPSSELDALVFEELFTRARRFRRDDLRAEAADAFEEALALWRGDPAEGIEASGFEAAIEQLRRMRREAEEEHAALRGALRREHETTGAARLLGADPVARSTDGRLRDELRSLLAAARPHPLPLDVLRRAVDASDDAVDRALGSDPATASAGHGPFTAWRLASDLSAEVDQRTVDRLRRASVAAATAASDELTGPDLREAAAAMRLLSPVLAAAVHSAVPDDIIEVTAAMGRWWSLEGRSDLTGVLTAPLLDSGGVASTRRLWALRWAMDLARRAGDGTIVEALVRQALPAASPRGTTDDALWHAIQGYAAELRLDHDAALGWFVDAASRWESAGSSAEVVVCLCNAAFAARLRGDIDGAGALADRARTQPAAVVAPLARFVVTMTDATNAFGVGEFGASRDGALRAEVLMRGAVERLADHAAMLAAESAFFRHDHDEARAIASRAGRAHDAATCMMANVVRAEVALADGNPGSAVRVLETTWAELGDLLQQGIGAVLAGTYARIASAVGRDDLAVELLTAATPDSGPWGRLDEELRRRLGAGSGEGGELRVIGRARELLVVDASRM